MERYTTWGSVRGCCAHEHHTLDAAEACAVRDQRGCSSQGGYSDRGVRMIERGGSRSYDVTRGPGEIQAR